ncbi:hypothetical protein BJX99DRAFT_254124 [Aspergillus californicus]
MLLRILSLSVFCLGSLVSADDPNYYPLPRLSSDPHQLNLTCADCAFSYSDCLENIHPNSFLTITFSTKHDGLYANDELIYPPPIPMKFHALRHWDATFDTVPLAYAFEIQPLPHQPDARLGDLYRLKLTLVDLQGRPAVVGPVTVGVARHPEGQLQIIDVEASGFYHHHHRLPSYKGSGSSSGSEHGSWWRMKTWKTNYISYLQKTSHKKPCSSDSTVDVSEPVNAHLASHCRDQNRLADWAGDRHYFKLARPVVIPALLGLAAGVFACAIGFLVGKVIVAVYYYRLERRVGTEDPEREIGKQVVSEKVRLMEIFADTESNTTSRL